MELICIKNKTFVENKNITHFGVMFFSYDDILMSPVRIELTTYRLGGDCSIQLSHGDLTYLFSHEKGML